MNPDKIFRVIKPSFGSARSPQKIRKEQRTKRELLEEIEAIRERLVELERIAGGVTGTRADPPDRGVDRESYDEHIQKEINKRLEVENVLEEKEKLLHLIFNLSTNFMYLSFDEIDSGVNDVLGIVGQFANVGRSYVLLFDKSGTRASSTHEWRAYGIESRIEKLQNVSVNDFPWFFQKIRNLEIIHVPDVSKLPDAEEEKKQSQNEHIQSLIVIPIVHCFELIGFLGLDSIAVKKTWPDDMIFLFRMVGEFFASAFVQRKTEEKPQESATRYRTLFEYANDSIFLIQGGNFFDCNSETLRLVKCFREDIIGRSSYEFSPEFQPDGRDSKEKIVEKTDAALAGKPQFFEWRFCSGNGTLFDADVSLNKIELGVEVLIQAIVSDVTVRKRWETGLER